MRVPWTARRSNQSIPREVSPEYLLEGLTLKLKLKYFDHLMRILLRVKQITSPGWIHETSAQGWCTGKTQRDWMGSRDWDGEDM